jgi:cobyric acid synthase
VARSDARSSPKRWPANVEPTVEMNPILVNPHGGACHVIVRGQVRGVQTAAEYFGPRRRDL